MSITKNYLVTKILKTKPNAAYQYNIIDKLVWLMSFYPSLGCWAVNLAHITCFVFCENSWYSNFVDNKTQLLIHLTCFSILFQYMGVWYEHSKYPFLLKLARNVFTHATRSPTTAQCLLWTQLSIDCEYCRLLIKSSILMLAYIELATHRM